MIYPSQPEEEKFEKEIAYGCLSNQYIAVTLKVDGLPSSVVWFGLV